ncbi:MAG: hypothetical protein PHI23_04115, partial [Candidatus Peribacteraceae bacterium]|nr:hypothetical protein [Candidatus Peribacteraceae bacterium]
GFIVEIAPAQEQRMREMARSIGTKLTRLGETRTAPSLVVARGGTTLLSEELKGLRELWQNGLLSAWK